MKWAKHFDSNQFATVSQTITDTGGNMYVVGYFQGTHNLGNGFVLSSPLSNNLDIFIAKFGSNGTCIWAMQIGKTGNDKALGIALDDKNYIYVVGQFSGINVEFAPLGREPSPVNSENQLAGINQGFLIRYNGLNGKFSWSWKGFEGYAATHVGVMKTYINGANFVNGLAIPNTAVEDAYVYIKGDGGFTRQIRISNREEVSFFGIPTNSSIKFLEFQAFVVKPSIIYGRITTEINADDDVHRLGGGIALIAGGSGRKYLSMNHQVFIQYNGHTSTFGRYTYVDDNTTDFAFNRSDGSIFTIVKNTNGQNNSVSFKVQKYITADDSLNISLTSWPEILVAGSGNAIVSPEDIKVTRSGNIYIVGYIQGQNVNFGNGFVLSTPQITPLLYNRSGFIAEYDKDGLCISARLLPSTAPDGSYLNTMNMSLSSSKISLGGNFIGTANLNACGGANNLVFTNPSTEPNVFIAQYSQRFSLLNNLSMEGTKLYCSTSEEYEVDDLPDASYSWTSSSNLSLQNTNSAFTTANLNGGNNGAAWVECNVSINNACFTGSRILRKDIWIGKPETAVLLGRGLVPLPTPYVLEFCAEKCEVYESIKVESKGAQAVGLFLGGQLINSFRGGIGELRIPLFYPAGQYTFQIISGNRCGLSEVRNITVTLKPKCGECLLGGRIIQAEVYPNPAEDILTIKAAEGTVFKLYDKLNREVLSGVVNETLEKNLNIKHLKSDIYFLHLINEEKQVLKVVKK